MPRVCILTDSTAQFTRTDFPGRERVFVLALDLEPVLPVPAAAPANSQPRRLLPPTPQAFLRYYGLLSGQFDAVLVLTLSSCLNPAAENARKAAARYSNHAAIQVVDSQTTSVGLGMLVEAAAGAASAGASLAEVEHLVRTAIRRIYMLLCIPELACLERLGLLDHVQTLVGEMIGLMPVFTVEEGGLMPMGKARTPRSLFESFEEFMDEFTAPGRVALLRGTSQTTLQTRPLREFVQERFAGTPYSEHSLNPSLSALFGRQAIGLVVMEPA
jgi:DegV family protein with EDD domain